MKTVIIGTGYVGSEALEIAVIAIFAVGTRWARAAARSIEIRAFEYFEIGYRKPTEGVSQESGGRLPA